MGIFKLNGVDYMGGGGGGGNSNEQSLSYAEYLALSEAEKTNDTNYYIYDINGDGQEFQPIVYSTDEREIGVWTDGKPLYQKTINVGSIAAATASTTNHNISNLENVISIVSTGFNTAEQRWNVIPRVDDAVAYQRSISVSDTQVIIQGPSQSQPLTNVNVTLLYTKTTDAAGSGTWTPQGVPTHHYSTSEQVIGTWIDGSTIYEKTVSFTAPSNNYVFEPIGVTNFNKCVGYSGFVALSGGTVEDINYSRSDSSYSTYYVAIMSDATVFFRTYSSTDGIVYITVHYTKTSL